MLDIKGIEITARRLFLVVVGANVSSRSRGQAFDVLSIRDGLESQFLMRLKIYGQRKMLLVKLFPSSLDDSKWARSFGDFQLLFFFCYTTYAKWQLNCDGK